MASQDKMIMNTNANAKQPEKEYVRFESALRQVLSAPKDLGKEKQSKPKPKRLKKKKS